MRDRTEGHKREIFIGIRDPAFAAQHLAAVRQPTHRADALCVKSCQRQRADWIFQDMRVDAP